MPKAIERALEKEAKRKAAYIYETLRKTGWKPKRK